MQFPCEVNMLKAAPSEGYFGAICRSRVIGEPAAEADVAAWVNGPGRLVAYEGLRKFLLTPDQVPEVVKSRSVHRVGAEWFGGKSPEECGFEPILAGELEEHAEDSVVLEMVTAGTWHALKR